MFSGCCRDAPLLIPVFTGIQVLLPDDEQPKPAEGVCFIRTDEDTGMSNCFKRNRPLGSDGVLDIYFDPVNGEVKDLAVFKLKRVPEEDLDLRSEIGLFRFFQLIQSVSIGSSGVDDFIDRLTEKSGNYRLKSGGTTSSTQYFSGDTLNNEVVFG